MRDLMTVFKFEFQQTLKRKVTLISTIVIGVILAILLSIPSFLNLSDSNQTDQQTTPAETFSVSSVFSDSGFVIADAEVKKALNPKTEAVYDNEEQLHKAVKSQEVKNGFVVESFTKFKVVYFDKSLTDYSDGQMKEVLNDLAIDAKLSQYGLSRQQFNEIRTGDIQSEVVILGKDSTKNIVFAYVALIIIYIAVLMYGQSVSTIIAREKDSRAMELLITSTKPKNLIMGKVMAVGAVTLLQLLILTIIVSVAYTLNKASYPPMITELMSKLVSADTLLVYFVFGFTGFVMYLFIFASLGSLVTKVEDVSASITPIMIIFMIGYFLASMTLNFPDSTASFIGSWVPFFSLMCMPIRYSMTSVNAFDLFGSLALMILFVVFFAYLSIKIYRLGSLNYGNKMSIFKVIKQVFSKNN